MDAWNCKQRKAGVESREGSTLHDNPTPLSLSDAGSAALSCAVYREGKRGATTRWVRPRRTQGEAHFRDSCPDPKFPSSLHRLPVSACLQTGAPTPGDRSILVGLPSAPCRHLLQAGPAQGRRAHSLSSWRAAKDERPRHTVAASPSADAAQRKGRCVWGCASRFCDEGPAGPRRHVGRPVLVPPRTTQTRGQPDGHASPGRCILRRGNGVLGVTGRQRTGRPAAPAPTAEGPISLPIHKGLPGAREACRPPTTPARAWCRPTGRFGVRRRESESSSSG